MLFHMAMVCVGPLGVVVDDSSGQIDEAPSTSSSVRKKPGSTTVVEMPYGATSKRKRLHPALEGELRGRVGGAELPADDAGGRGDGDDLAAALGAHDRQDRAGDVERAEEVGLHLRPELGVADLLEVAGVEVAGVVDEHVDPSEPLDGRIDGGLSGGGVGDVEGDGEQVVVLAEGRGDLGGVAGGGDDGVAGVEGGLGQVDAHAAGGAGDEPDRWWCQS